MVTNAEMHNFLSRRESRRILNKASDDAASLKTTEAAWERNSKPYGIDPSLRSTFDEVEFDLDFEIINTTAYWKAFRSAIKQSLTQQQGSIGGPKGLHSTTQDIPLGDIAEDLKDSGTRFREPSRVHPPNMNPRGNIPDPSDMVLPLPEVDSEERIISNTAPVATSPAAACAISI